MGAAAFERKQWEVTFCLCPSNLFIYLVPSKMTHLCGSRFLLRFKHMIGCVLRLRNDGARFPRVTGKYTQSFRFEADMKRRQQKHVGKKQTVKLCGV